MSYQIKSILYASDLSPRSPAVFRHAVGLAEKFGAKLHAVTVTLPTSELPWVEFVTQDTLEQVKTTGCERREAELKKYHRQLCRSAFGIRRQRCARQRQGA